MPAFLAAVVVTLILGAGAAIILNDYVQRSTSLTYASEGARPDASDIAPVNGLLQPPQTL
jgi:hypothetical protein